LSTFLIFGASGAIGRLLLPRLLAAGGQVHAVSRAPPALPADPRLAWIGGDLYAEIAPLPDRVDAIISLGPLDGFAAWFERSAVAGVRRVIALSSMSAQSKQASFDLAERDLAARLLAAETRVAQAAQARGATWTLLRPTLIYGAGHDRSLAPIARFARRWRVMPIVLGADGLRQPVHAADLAGAVAAALDCSAAAGRIYPIGGGERLPFDVLVRRLRAATPGFVLPVPVPLFVLYVLARVLRWRGPHAAAALHRLRTPLLADNAAAANDFGYSPRAFIAADVLPER